MLCRIIRRSVTLYPFHDSVDISLWEDNIICKQHINLCKQDGKLCPSKMIPMITA